MTTVRRSKFFHRSTPAMLAAGLFVLSVGSTTTAQTPQPFRAGAAVVDISPVKLPVIVNAMFTERSADRVADRLTARAIALDDGTVRLAICVVDTCMMPRSLIDEAKEIAQKATGIPTQRMLVSATHTHSAPSAMGCLGSRVDPEYARMLPAKIAETIERAATSLEPARAGWGAIDAPEHTFCRRWIRRPDRLMDDPFGEKTVRAHMHPGHESPDVIGPSGPVDPQLSLLSIQSTEGRAIALLANFSMHYYDSPLLSSDYFGRFADKIALALGGAGGAAPFVAIMSQGTSGDQQWMDYSRPRRDVGYDAYAAELAAKALEAHRAIQHRSDLSLAMAESKLRLRYRTPDAKRLERARAVAAGFPDRLPRSLPEIYALEAIQLHERQETELVLQAIRIGELGIAAMPNEVFALTGLKVKAQSPLSATFTIELANGAEGYIPPPEQHALGGYTTWPARTAGLEVQAEPRIADGVLKLLEEVSGKPRRAVAEPRGPYTRAVLDQRPLAHFRLDAMQGLAALDATKNGLNAELEGGAALYLLGPPLPAASGAPNRCVHLAGGRLRIPRSLLGERYAASLWFWSGLPHDAREVAATLCARERDGLTGDQLQIAGTAGPTGKLVFLRGRGDAAPLAGRTVLTVREWHHLLLSRDGKRVTVWLDGLEEPEIDGTLDRDFPDGDGAWSFGGATGGVSLEGKLDEVALFDRPLGSDAARWFWWLAQSR